MRSRSPSIASIQRLKETSSHHRWDERVVSEHIMDDTTPYSDTGVELYKRIQRKREASGSEEWVGESSRWAKRTKREGTVERIWAAKK